MLAVFLSGLGFGLLLGLALAQRPAMRFWFTQGFRVGVDASRYDAAHGDEIPVPFRRFAQPPR